MARHNQRSIEETPTWAVAIVCFVLILISIFIEQIIHHIGLWLKKRNKVALFEALEKIKSELMLLGFISILLTILQEPVSEICVSHNVATSWHPCAEIKDNINYYDDNCSKKDQNKVALMSMDAIHQLHIFIFVLALCHVIYCITTLALGRLKMRGWRSWENETKSIEYQYINDRERFRIIRETSFGRRHLRFWSKYPVLLYTVCFFRQFLAPVTKVDYLTLRHGFITAHMSSGSETKFDFRKYINRSLEEDFTAVVGITPMMWFFACLYTLSYTNGWYSYYWMPFIPLIIILLVGTRLQVIITQMGLRIQEREVIQGTLIVEPSDDLFWFSNPRFMLFLIHFALFQNAFQLAFIVFTWYKYGLKSCFHRRYEDVIIRTSMSILVHILCSYVTLPLYALVTQMGSTMKPTVFSEKVAKALKEWHHSVKKTHKHGQKNSEGVTPYSSRQSTPSQCSSPVHLLHRYHQPHGAMIINNSDYDNLQTPPRSPIAYGKEYWVKEAFGEGGIVSSSAALNHCHKYSEVPVVGGVVMLPVKEQRDTKFNVDDRTMSMMDFPSTSDVVQDQHEIEIITTNDFSFQQSAK